MGDRGGVFISYRRDDSRGSAGRLYDGIAERIGRASVFRDLDALAPGAEYGKDILAAIGQCSAFIAVIGPKWLEARDATGQRRIDRTDDLVRIEIATALAQRKVVIPVLVDDGDMPPPEQLPPDLAPLASRNALSISDQRWEYDLGRLMAVLDGAAGRGPAANADPSPPPAVPDRRGRSVERRLAKVILALVVVGVFAASALRDGPSPNDDITAPEPTVTTPPSSVRSESTSPTSAAAPRNAMTINVGDTVENGEIATPGAKQVYTFTGTAGQIVYLKARYKGTCCDLGWKLLAPSGSVLGDRYMSSDLGRVILPASGAYTIEVAGSGAGTGIYGFELLRVPPDVTLPISVGDTVEKAEIATPGAKQVYTFAGTAGQTVYIKARYTGTCCDLGWQLLGPSGSVLGDRYMSSDLGRVTLSANGTHTIQVYGSGTGTGTYGFELTPVQ